MKPIVPEKTRRHLEWPRILERLAHHCRGPVAEERALHLDFAANPAELSLRLARVDEARRLIDARKAPPLGGVPDVIPWAARASRGGVLDAEELIGVGHHLDVAARCRRYFDQLLVGAPHLKELAEQLAQAPDLAREILGSFDESGQLADHASGELGHLRGRVTSLHTQLKESIHTLVKAPEYADLLQDEYFTIREDRYVLPIKSGHKTHVPGIVHGWSQTGATVYIEPEAVLQANNRLLMAQAEVDREIRRILAKLSERVGRLYDVLKKSQEALATLDLTFASGSLSEELDATSPEIGEEPSLELKSARHPLLVLAGTAVVPNTIVLASGQRGLIITGPNTGGKTVALKTAGLCALMALCGLHIPAAPGSRLPALPGVFTDIGDEQSLQESKSTFSGHIANLQAIFAVLRPGSLVLLDEIVVGTDPVQGAALAQAILERLADLQTYIVVTTHYESLKALPLDDGRFRNGAVGFDAERRVPTYRLELDVPGSSSALITARRLGLDPLIIDRALELTGPEQRRLEGLIQRLESETAGLYQARRTLEAEREELSILLASVAEKEERLRVRLREGVARERDQALRSAKAAREELDKLKRQLLDPAKKRDAAWIDSQRSKVGELVERLVTESRAAEESVAGPPLDPTSLRVGSKVYVLSLNADAELVGLPDDKGRVQVRLGLLTANVPVGDLRDKRAAAVAKKAVAARAEPRAAETTRPSDRPALTWESAPPQVPDNTVDVRGMRGDEALEQVERFLDAQLEREVGVAYIIHGHGTGALKREIREWLGHSRYARDWRRGDRHEGGDGMTAVLLR
jgi:DNA mismatch repair protein MutS2